MQYEQHLSKQANYWSRISIIVVVIFIIIFAAVYRYWLVENKEPKKPKVVTSISTAKTAPYPTATPSFIITSTLTPTPVEPPNYGSIINWKTYTDEKYGYSIKYPRELVIELGHENYISINKQIYIVVSPYNPLDCSKPCQTTESIESIEDTSISGMAAKKVTGSIIGRIDGKIPQKFERFIVKRNVYYILTAYELKSDVIMDNYKP